MMLLDYAHGNWMQEKPTVIKEKILPIPCQQIEFQTSLTFYQLDTP